MNLRELDQLAVKNEARIRDIEDRYFQRRDGIKTYKEIIEEQKENWETKIFNRESVESYPTYGRGLTPAINMNTFML
jgi:hypothetical protein